MDMFEKKKAQKHCSFNTKKDCKSKLECESKRKTAMIAVRQQNIQMKTKFRVLEKKKLKVLFIETK